jgi:hypothetical protein
MSKIKKLIRFIKSAWHEQEGYNSIDNCPITVFDEICSTSNVSLLGWTEKEENWKAWENINKQYTDTYGVSEDYKMLVKLRLICFNLRKEILSGKIWKKPFLVERERQIEELANKTKSDIYESITMISQILGMQLDMKITIREFMAYSQSIKKRQSIK